jgi:hypothetical protein
MSKQWKKADDALAEALMGEPWVIGPGGSDRVPWGYVLSGRRYGMLSIVRPIEFALQRMALDGCSGKHGPAPLALEAKRGPMNAG